MVSRTFASEHQEASWIRHQTSPSLIRRDRRRAYLALGPVAGIPLHKPYIHA